MAGGQAGGGEWEGGKDVGIEGGGRVEGVTISRRTILLESLMSLELSKAKLINY